ncbi:MAG TPA: DUF3053 family protein [Xanthobacteraceae bacterium]|nr:DUF3053 family protein [Xanthobacteraceae bacterium]
MQFIQKFAAGIALAFLVFNLVACGDEAAERKALIDFLQTRIIAKPGVHFAVPSDVERKSFGAYAAHYDVILNFRTDLDAAGASMRGIASLRQPASLQDVIEMRDTIAKVRGDMEKAITALPAEIAKAEAARAALKQPDDLKSVYDQAFARVMAPAHAFADGWPVIDAAFRAILDFDDFVKAHKDAISFRGPQMVVSDPAIQAQLQAKSADAAAKGKALAELQQKLKVLLYGT